MNNMFASYYTFVEKVPKCLSSWKRIFFLLLPFQLTSNISGKVLGGWIKALTFASQLNPSQLQVSDCASVLWRQSTAGLN